MAASTNKYYVRSHDRSIGRSRQIEFAMDVAKVRPARTKIVATVGPASRDRGMLVQLVQAGVDVFRLNMAHGTRAEHDETLDAIRSVSQQLNQPIAVLADLAGPKIRLGELPGGAIDCVADSQLTFVRGDVAGENELVTNYPKLVDELRAGDRVMLADATVELVVEAAAGDAVTCRVVQPGLIRNRQGVNLPGARLSVSALGDDDRDNARWAASRDVDFVGLSFVRSADEIRELKSLLGGQDSTAHVIAKIEKPEALQRLDEIVEAADGVMVARGDLGVEIDIAEVPLAQKQIVAECIKRQRPVIIATQMLASMEHSRHPTRAEVTDVANAVLDGADACMLSGETAIGEFPREAVAMMNRIAVTTERRFRSSSETPRDQPLAGVHRITEAVVYGAARIARQLDARLLVVATRSGATALAVSRQRLFTPVLALSDDEATLRRMCLYSGLTPVRGAPIDDWAALTEWVADWGAATGELQTGDYVLSVAGTNITAGVHNAVAVHQI